MKKISFVLALAMIISMLSVSVFAADTTASLTSVTAKAGDEITLTLSIKNSPGIAGTQFYVGYDSSVMSYVSAKSMDSNFFAAFSPEEGANPVKVVTANLSLNNITGDITVAPVPTETKTVKSNGTYAPTSGKYFSSVTVEIPDAPVVTFETQEKSVSPTESVQTVTPDSGYDGLSKVTVNAISSTYVGSGVTKKGATTITPNSSQQTAVGANVYTTGAITVAAVPTETKNVTANGTYTPTDGKYFSSVTVNIPKEEFSTQSKTITPTKSQHTVTPDNGYDGLSSVVVNAIPSEYVTTSDANAVAADLAEGKTAYVNGQKITGTHTCSEGIDTSDATATAEDIMSGKTAYVNGEKITGTLVVQNYYTGDTEPNDSFGDDGDLYFCKG